MSLKQTITNIREYAIARDYYTEVVMRNCEISNFRLSVCINLEQVLNTKGEQAFNDRKNNLIGGLEPLYKDFNAQCG